MFTDEQLVAYADGELPASEAAPIAAAAATDAVLAQRIARFTESRRVLHEAFAPHLDAPVPQRLLDTVQGGATVAPSPRPRFRTDWLPMALAASLALAVGLAGGSWFSRQQAFATVAGLPADRAALAHVLETQASGEPLRTARFEILPTASLRAGSGAYCREFESAVFGAEGTARARAIACRDEDGAWQTIAAASIWTAPDAAPDDAYIPAGGPAVDFGALMAGLERLTPEQEQTLIGHHWRSP